MSRVSQIEEFSRMIQVADQSIKAFDEQIQGAKSRRQWWVDYKERLQMALTHYKETGEVMGE